MVRIPSRGTQVYEESSPALIRIAVAGQKKRPVPGQTHFEMTTRTPALPYAPGTILVLALLILSGCKERQNIGQTEEGALILGTTEVTEAIERSVSLNNRTLVLEGFAGSIRLNGTSAAQARLEFVKKARGGNDEDALRKLEGISIDEVGDNQSYRYTMRSEDAGLASVDITGDVPVNTSVRIQTESGHLALSGVEGPIRITHQNGSIDIAGARRTVEAETRSGDITLGLSTLADGSDVRLRTYNGDVYLTLPQATSATIEAGTSAGTVSVNGITFAERALTPRGAGALFRGRLGEGDTEISLQTENGSIHIREGSVLSLPRVDSLMGIEPGLPADTTVPADSLIQPDEPEVRDTSLQRQPMDTTVVVPPDTVGEGI